MSAIVLNLPQRRPSDVTACPSRPEPAPLVDLAAYRRTRDARVRRRRLEPVVESDDDEGWADEGWTDRVHRIIDAAEELLAAGRAGEVAEFCTLAARYLDRNAAELGNPGALACITDRLGALYGRACAGL